MLNQCSHLPPLVPIQAAEGCEGKLHDPGCWFLGILLFGPSGGSGVSKPFCQPPFSSLLPNCVSPRLSPSPVPAQMTLSEGGH